MSDNNPYLSGAASVANTTANVGQYVANTANLPYIRAQAIGILAIGLKPNTRMSLFFDAKNLTAYCAPASVDPSVATPTSANFYALSGQGTPLVTDDNGNITAIMYLPASVFYIGDRTIELFDWSSAVDTRTERASNSTCRAQTIFHAFNFSTTEPSDAAILATIPEQRPSSNSVTITNRGTGTSIGSDPNAPRFDPMCQSFYVGADMTQGQDGVYLTSIDLYFGAKSATQGFAIDIRTVENNLPSSKILPNSTVTLNANQITANSTAASQSTTFTFETPVYLRSGYSYALACSPGGQSPDYRLWTAVVGKADATNGTVNANWGQGVLFTTSTGSQWTPVQNEFLKFSIRRADFSTFAAGGNALLTNEDFEFLTIRNISSIPFQVGEYVYQQPMALPGLVTVNTTSNSISVNTSASTLNPNLTSTFAVNDHILVIGSLPTSDAYNRINFNIFANAISLRVVARDTLNNKLTFAYANGAAAVGATFANAACYFFKPLKGLVSLIAGSRSISGINTRFDQDIAANILDTCPLIVRHGNSTVVGTEVLIPNTVTNATSVALKNAPFTSNSTGFPFVAPVGRVVSIDYNLGLIVLDKSTANATSGNTDWTNTYATVSYFAPGRVLHGSMSGAACVIDRIINVPISSMQPNFYTQTVQGTDVQYSANLTTNEYDTVNFPKLAVSDTMYFQNTNIIVASKSNEIMYLSGNKSVQVNATLTSSSKVLSPSVDVEHSGLLTKSNLISESSAYEHTNNGTAVSKAVEKMFSLGDGNDAEDIQLYITAYKPPGTNIKMYAKILNANDPESFYSKDWTELEQLTDSTLFSDASNRDDVKEYQFSFYRDPRTTLLSDDIVTTNNSAVITSTNANTAWQSLFTNNQLVVLYSDAYQTSYEVKLIQSVDSNTQMTFATAVSSIANTSAAVLGQLSMPFSAFKNTLNTDIVRYYTADGVSHDSYKQIAIKTVFTSNSVYQVPEVMDMRAICLSV